jgi:hypothetical protein
VGIQQGVVDSVKAYSQPSICGPPHSDSGLVAACEERRNRSGESRIDGDGKHDGLLEELNTACSIDEGCAGFA